jgi:hypothetical protein
VGAGVDARQARAAEHRVDAVAQGVSPNAAPEGLDGALVAVTLGDAGAAQLQEPQARVARDERVDVEFCGAVEAEAPLRDLLAQHTVGADDRRSGRLAVDDDDMVADGVEPA